MKKPIVGISGSELTKNVGPFVGYRRSYVNKDYSEAVIKNGGVPMIIPFNEDADVTESQLELVDALILSGGQDIDSESYGEEPQPEQGTVWQARDQFDMQLLKLAEKRGIPVLGICRGAQLINVFHGGSLYQDLKYYPVPTLKHWQGDTPWWQATHQVKLVKDTHLAAIFDQVPRLRVNSYHHQLIKKVGKGLKVNALAQDGVYEGIENETGKAGMNMQNKTDKLGFWSIVLLAINSIIGSGIFLTPGSVVTMVGTKAPLVYLIAAVFAAMLALTFAAAAKYVTKSGAAYSYAKAAYGENMGFYMGVVRFFSASVAWGVMGVGVIKSTLSIFGADSTSFKNITWGFVVLMAIILLINFFGQRFLTWVSNLATIGKLLALGLIIIAGIIVFLKTGVSHFHDLDTLKAANGQPLIPKLTTSGLVMAVIAAFYAFTGFESVASGSEDMKDPQKNLPRAIPLAIMVIALVYIGTILVAMAINPAAIVKTKQVVAITAIFQARWLRVLIELGALISMFGINSMVGSGIFLLPGVLFQDAGNWSLALILLAALAVLAMAYCYAEMAHHFSGNGAGWYYTYKEFGRFWGFEIGLFTWLQGAAAIATEIAAFLRGLRPWLPKLGEITAYRWAGLGMILILLTIRLLGKKASTWANNFSTVLKLAVLGLFVVLGIFYVKPGNFNAAVHNSIDDFDHAFMLIFFMFPGFSFLPVQASSIHNSKKNLPKLLIGVVISVAVIYMVTMSVAIGMLGNQIDNADAPLAWAFGQQFGQLGEAVIMIGMLGSIAGVAISMFYSTPYVVSSLANEKALLPRFIGIKSQNGVPYVATLLTAGIVLILVMSGDYLALIPCSIMIAVVQYAFVAMATIKLEFADLKRRHAQGKIDHIDIYEMVLAMIALLCCLFLARFVTPLAIEITAGIALVGVVSYLGQLIRRPPAEN